ncbi:MAG: efflux RND transporter periplasmic adaptor subunit [Porticoccaceae bacterium]|nr:efflux RND transporter periplasmic adaptor subunit [Porticoccaceae bacterium]
MIKTIWVLPFILLTGCDQKLPEADPPTVVRPAKIYTVKATSEPQQYQLFARVANRETIDMQFEVAGQLVALPIREGEKINRGDLIAELDANEHKLALERAQTSLKLASQELNRFKKLYAKGILSVTILDESQTRYQLRRIDVAQAQEILKDSKIMSPFDALVLQRYKGNHSAVIAGDVIASLTRSDKIELLTDMPEKLVVAIQKYGISQNTARFTANPEKVWPLLLVEQSAQASPATQTYQTRFVLEQLPDWDLLQGMTAQISLTLPATSAELFVPTSALQTDIDGSLFVWVTSAPDYTARKRLVEVGSPRSARVVITAGLADGEIIIAAGGSVLHAGQKVHPMIDHSGSLHIQND